MVKGCSATFYVDNVQLYYLLGTGLPKPGAGFTKPSLERTYFSKGRSFFFFGKATLKLSFTKAPLTLLTKGLP